MNHTGHEVYKCARVTGHTNKFVFQWFNSCYRSFLFHLCIILYNFLVCILYTFEFVCYIHASSNVWFHCKTSECLVSFQFLIMSCMGSFQWPFDYKKLLLSNKNICWASYLFSCDLSVGFSRAVNFFPYLFFIAQ